MEDSRRFQSKVRLLLGLIRNGYLKDINLFQAFLEVKLTDFIPRRLIYRARIYDDVPNLFYFDRNNPENLRTISAPHMISIMLQGLVLDEDDELLILGAKSGYIAALANKLSSEGRIVILEANSKIAKFTKKNLEKLNYKNIEVIVKNPLDGLVEQSPWQKILVTGAIRQERIYTLLKQLDPNSGVLFAPIGGDYIQTYTQILRSGNNFYAKKQLQVRFTPLITEMELDDIELITDIDEMELCIESEDSEKSRAHLDCDPVSIKYASEIIDDIDLKPLAKFESMEVDPYDIAEVFFNNIKDTINILKYEEKIKEWVNGIENIQTQIKVLDSVNEDFYLGLDIFNTINPFLNFLFIF
jgi:protein-L-isoaspartate(D-aspartate) O-methyltransferase